MPFISPEPKIVCLILNISTYFNMNIYTDRNVLGNELKIKNLAY